MLLTWRWRCCRVCTAVIVLKFYITLMLQVGIESATSRVESITHLQLKPAVVGGIRQGKSKLEAGTRAPEDAGLNPQVAMPSECRHCPP
jgi:hypothetical protein